MRAALIAGLLAAPVGALFAWAGDIGCNHLVGDVEVAEPGTPRGDWCGAVVWHHHWLALIAVPVVVTMVAVLAAGRRPWLYLPAWGLGAAVAAAPVVHLFGLRAYPLA